MRQALFCLADTKDSSLFLRACYNLGQEVVVLIRHQWIDSTDLTEAIRVGILRELTEESILGAIERIKECDGIVPYEIVSFSERSVAPVNSVKKSLALPHLNEDQIEWFTNKWAMRKRSQEKEIKIPKFCTLKGARREFKDYRGKLIIKPMRGNCCENIEVCHGFVCLPAVDGDGLMVVEEYIEGQVFHVDVVRKDGRTFYRFVAEYERPLLLSMQQKNNFFMEYSLPESSHLYGLLVEANEKVLDAFDYRNGPSHTEFIVTTRGDIYLCETAARTAGNELSLLQRHTKGMSAMEAMAHLAVGSEDVSTSRNDYYVGYLNILADRDDRVREIGFKPPPQRTGQILHCALTASAGDIVSKGNYYGTELAKVIVKSENRDCCLGLMKEAIESLVIIYEGSTH